MAEFRSVQVVSSLGITDQVTLSAAINQFPQVVCSKQIDAEDGEAVKIHAGDFVALAKEEQARILSSRSAPDFSVRIDDGQRNIVDFQGYTLGAGAKIAADGVSCMVSGIHRGSLLSAYRPDIYQTYAETRIDESSPLKVTGASIMGRLKEILKRKTDAWGDETLRRRTGVDYVDAIYDEIHTTNESLRNTVDELLGASEESTSYELFSTLEGFEGANSALNAKLAEMLDMHSGNFFQSLQTLATIFRLIYVPDKSGSTVGYFCKLSDIFAEPVEVECACVSWDISVSSATVLPVSSVLVHGLVAAEVRSTNTNTQEVWPGYVSDILARFPEEPAEGGTTTMMPAPEFLQFPVRHDWLSEGEEMDPEQAIADYEALSNEVLEFSTQLAQQFGSEWARQGYLDTVLAANQVTLTTDLDLAWEAGTFYVVKARSAKDGSTLMFKGLLQSEVHTISSNQNAPMAVSVLSFSHVLIGDQTLPGLE